MLNFSWYVAKSGNIDGVSTSSLFATCSVGKLLSVFLTQMNEFINLFSLLLGRTLSLIITKSMKSTKSKSSSVLIENYLKFGNIHGKMHNFFCYKE